MKIAAMVLAVLLGSASMLGQAAASYVGALSPATGFAARPINPAVRVHPRQSASTAPAARCKRPQKAQAQCPRRAKDGTFAEGKPYKRFVHTETRR